MKSYEYILSELEDWLQSDGNTATAHDVELKIKELKENYGVA
jgi:hypothetical protein